jgi:hypothetical protein
MAVGATANAEGFSSSRRLAIGANVALAVVLGAAVLIAVNWIASIKTSRTDLASYGNYGLSERMKSIIRGCTEPIELSYVYMPDEEDEKQQGYTKRLQDYCDEFQRFAGENPKVTITHVASDSQREKLVASLSSKFGGEAEKHQAAIAKAQKLSTDLQVELAGRLAAAQALMEGKTWLGAFPIFANITAILKADVESLKKNDEAVKELVPQTGIPKFGEATTKIKTEFTEVKKHFEAISQRLRELSLLAAETKKPDSPYIALLGEVSIQVKSLIASLRTIVGANDAPMPAKPSKELKSYADRGPEVDAALKDIVRKVDDFARKFPSVKQHPSWAASVQMGGLMARMEVADVLEQVGEGLASSRLEILGVLDKADAAELQKSLTSVRRRVTMLEQNAEACERLMTDLAEGLTGMDPESGKLLDSAGTGELFKDRIAAIDELDKELTALPELKLGSVADQLREPNTLVIETKGKVRAVSFNEVFPVRESIAGPGNPSKDELDRTFNGDSAIASALLTLTREQPFATVVFTAFEPPAPQQRSPFMQPPQPSWIPSAQLSDLRKRLEASNFKCVDWNLANAPEAPKPEEGTQNIYVLLPPPPPNAQQPFFNQPKAPEPKFEDSHREIIRRLLDNDARVIALATWEIRSAGMMGGSYTTPPYGYGPLLGKDWGLEVDNSRRITWVEPDRRTEDGFVVLKTFLSHLPVGGFTDHPLGVPLKGTRFIVSDACSIFTTKEIPPNVTITPILRIPLNQNYIAPSISELITIFDTVNDPNSGGVVRLKPPPSYGPFDLAVAAERKEADKSKGKLVLLGMGASYRDGYLNQPVMSGGERLRLDPAPTESVDLFVNSLYWLLDQPQLIARGPVPVPRIQPIEAGQLKFLRVLVWGIWPALVFAPGIIFWTIRRR